jgi:hypothetical protein
MLLQIPPLWPTYRLLKRCHRTVTGASTLTRRKKGRRSRTSTTCSSNMSVVTHRSCHLNVTKSSNLSTSGNVCWVSASLESSNKGTGTFEADFSTAGIAAVRARRRRVNWCSSMRYEAIDALPAQMPRDVRRQWVIFEDLACLHRVR